MKNVLLIGGGGRECAMAAALRRSPQVDRIDIAPGNAGMEKYGVCHDVKAMDIPGVIKLAKELQPDLVLVAADDPLAAGLVDDLQKEGFLCFGPTKGAARIEWDKYFAKRLMWHNGVPTPQCSTFVNVEEALDYVELHPYPLVIKANGLALGKGVLVCKTPEEAKAAIQELMVDKKFGASGDLLLVEEFVQGEELSVLAFCDGERVALMPNSRDHKKAFDGDEGPNTGGMGVVCPTLALTPEDEAYLIRRFFTPILKGLQEEGVSFRGVLYAGLIFNNHYRSHVLELTEGEDETKVGEDDKVNPMLKSAWVLEYNSRFGDPEAEAILPLLESDFYEICESVAKGQLDPEKVTWKEASVATVIYASQGYPAHYEKGLPIYGLTADGAGISSYEGKVGEDYVVYHCGTKHPAPQAVPSNAKGEEAHFVSNGGRVLAVSHQGKTAKEAISAAYEAIAHIDFPGGFYRKDIGHTICE